MRPALLPLALFLSACAGATPQQRETAVIIPPKENQSTPVLAGSRYDQPMPVMAGPQPSSVNRPMPAIPMGVNANAVDLTSFGGLITAIAPSFLGYGGPSAVFNGSGVSYNAWGIPTRWQK